MAVTGTEEGRLLTAAISGEVDHHHAGGIMADLDRHIDACLPRSLILDLGGVTFMDSSGIAVVLRTYKRVKELGGELTVKNVPPQAGKVLHAAGLSRLIKFEDE